MFVWGVGGRGGGDSAEVDLFILQSEYTNRTRLGLERGRRCRAVGGGGGHVFLDDLPDRNLMLDAAAKL